VQPLNARVLAVRQAEPGIAPNANRASAQAKMPGTTLGEPVRRLSAGTPNQAS
jgi:hypothetical protein